MSEPVSRYSITVPPALMEAFDGLVERRGLSNRSEAIRDLLRDALVEERWERDDAVVMGTVTVVYDHHRRELSRRLTALQHEAHEMVVCTTHVHLDAHHCLEVIVLRGRAAMVGMLADGIIGTRGVIHGKLVCTAVTGAGAIEPDPDADSAPDHEHGNGHGNGHDHDHVLGPRSSAPGPGPGPGSRPADPDSEPQDPTR